MGVEQLANNELALTASTPCELAECNKQLIKWCEHKMEEATFTAEQMKKECAELDNQAKQNNFTLPSLETIRRKARNEERRVTFFQRIKLALQQGYHIVPNFPNEVISVFAVRTNRTSPVAKMYTMRSSVPDEKPLALPAGEGEYVNPETKVHEEHTGEMRTRSNGQKEEIIHFFPDEDFQEIEFPFIMAKPHIMEATSKAMALKIFDEIGIIPAGRRRSSSSSRAWDGDPMILATICDTKLMPYAGRKKVTFMISWHLETAKILG